jgi:hypothetical protein
MMGGVEYVKEAPLTKQWGSAASAKRDVIFQASDLQSERGAMQATDLQGPCGVAGVEYAKDRSIRWALDLQRDGGAAPRG